MVLSFKILSMKYNGIIAKKLAQLSDEYSNLTAFLEDISEQEFISSWSVKSATERSLQVMIEIIIDIAERIISLENIGPVTSSADAIEKLVILKVLEKAEPFNEMVRFRNRLVHMYDSIEPEVLYEIVTVYIKDIIRFKTAIETL